MAVTENSLNKLVNRLEHLCDKLEKGPLSNNSILHHQIPNGTSRDSNGDENSPTVLAYDEMMSEPLHKYEAASNQQGGLIQQQAQMVMECFNLLRKALVQAAQANSQNAVPELIDPLRHKIRQVVEFADKNRPSPFFNQLSFVASSIPALGWVYVSPTPVSYIKEVTDSGIFYLNRVIMENKGKDAAPVAWANTFEEILKNLYYYVKRFHTTGLSNFKAGTPAQTPGPAATPASKAGRTPAKESTQPASLESQIKDKKAKTQLEGNRWAVEYHINNPKIQITSDEIKQTVYVYKCIDCTIEIKGKVNSISLDNCKKCALVFDSVISQVEVTNNKSAQIQVLHKCPLISLDNCDGAQIYLSKESMDIQVITAKSTEININVPQGEDGDYKEHPIPEQYKSVWNKDHFETTVVEKKG